MLKPKLPPSQARNLPGIGLVTPGFDRPETPVLCSTAGCGRNAKWEAELHLFPGKQFDPHRMFPWVLRLGDGIYFCDHHKEQLRAHEVLSHECKQYVEELAKKAKNPPPAWNRTLLKWNPMGSSFPA